jgi:phage terminase large subunit-like protein
VTTTLTPGLTTCPPRFATPRNLDRPTLGGAVGEVAVRLGLPLMPWQQQVIDVALELDDDGSYHYDEVVMTVPRQSGKTALVMAMAVHRLVVVPRTLGRQRMTYTAQTRQKARLKLERDFAEVLRGARGFREVPHQRARPQGPTQWKLSLNNGAENIQFGAGSYLQIDAPSRTGGHGDTLDVGVIDEAFAHQDDTIETGMEPSMATRRNHQLVVLSTAGDAQSFFLWRKVLAGRQACEDGDHGRTAYLEWSAPDDADPSDPATWWSCSPALGFTQPERFLQGQWQKALRGGQEAVNKFRRSYLNQWPEIPVLDETTFQVVAAAAWQACRDLRSEPVGRLAFALDVDSNAAGEEWCSIACSDGSHVEVVTPQEAGPGLDWVPAAVASKRDRFDEILLDPNGPAVKLIQPLEQAGVKVRKVKSPEFVAASGQFVDRVNVGLVRHLDQPVLNRAVKGAARRDVGDGAWKLSRTRSAVDISPLVASTIALWAASEASPAPPLAFVIGGS